MENEEKLVVFEKYANPVDANIVKGALEASGIPAGVFSDSTANTIMMAPVSVMVFERDMEAAIRAVYQADKNYEDYQEEMDLPAFENMQACNKAFAEVALKIHPEIGGKQYRDVYAQAKNALEMGDLKTLTTMNEQFPSIEKVKAPASVVESEPVKIHGWLLLYLVLAVIVDVMAVAVPLIMSRQLNFKPFDIGSTVFLLLAGCVMTSFLILAFKQRKPYAAFLGRHHVLVNAGPGLIVLAGLVEVMKDYYPVAGLGLLFIIQLFIWRPFFYSSSQVKALIPPSNRKVNKRLKYGITLLYVAIAIVYSLAMVTLSFKWWEIVLFLFLFLGWSPLFDSPSELGEDKEDQHDQ